MVSERTSKTGVDSIWQDDRSSLDSTFFIDVNKYVVGNSRKKFGPDVEAGKSIPDSTAVQRHVVFYFLWPKETRMGLAGFVSTARSHRRNHSCFLPDIQSLVGPVDTLFPLGNVCRYLEFSNLEIKLSQDSSFQKFHRSHQVKLWLTFQFQGISTKMAESSPSVSNLRSADVNGVDWCGLAKDYVSESNVCHIYRILVDTTDFYDVNYGDVILLDDVGYLVRGTETEKKFGLEGEPKPWVKSCVDLTTGARKIIKIPFYEEFECRIEGIKSTCLRNPEKEARILSRVRGHSGFMQGFSRLDSNHNNVRIIERIAGMSLDNVVRSVRMDHYSYYSEVLPDLLDRLVEAYRAMGDLHEMGEIHGDISPDHLYVERESGRFIWIDFDYDYSIKEDLKPRDLFEMGTLLGFVVGKDYLSYSEAVQRFPVIADDLTIEDMQLVFPNQVANLRLIYPYIHSDLNEILMRFSTFATERYASANELADDIEHALRRFERA